jgi:uncharacterized protein YdcH (DUF465 family)
MRCLNGHAVPPMVCRSRTETLIAQNAHNFVWEKYRTESDALDNQIYELRRAKAAELDGEVERRDALKRKVKDEIDALIIAEIEAFRQEQTGKGGSPLEERLDRLEETIEMLRSELAEIRNIADEAMDIAQEALDAADE